MSYIRGDNYVWDNEEGLHIWLANGHDWLMFDSGWGEAVDKEKVGGVVMPMSTFDELVVMRYAELQDSEELEQTIQRAMKRWGGNGGCIALLKRGHE